MALVPKPSRAIPTKSYADISDRELRAVKSRILRWGEANLRHFFWRQEGVSAFAVLVTEILVARTRAAAVEPVVIDLLGRFPNAGDLAKAPVREVEDILRPLGLYRKRAKHMIACADKLASAYGGSVPSDVRVLQGLPYVGRYAANAIACVAFGKPCAVVDANVARVYQRVLGLPEPPLHLHSAHALWALAARAIPKRRARDYNWALLDIGATICTPRRPSCERCPLRAICVSRPHMAAALSVNSSRRSRIPVETISSGS
jgi:A/G-specific adenine glycosylase